MGPATEDDMVCGVRDMSENGCKSVKEEKQSLTYPAGMKWTRPRKYVYEILQGAAEPLSAAEIYRRIVTEYEEADVAVSTVYRVLAAFEEKGTVIRQTRPDDNNAVYEWDRGEHTHYAVCLECHKRIALHDCPFAHLHLDGATKDFLVTGHKLELYGYCKDCAPV